MDKPAGTPLAPGLVARVAAGVRFALTGQMPEWFGPSKPIEPMAPPEVKGRQFDYPTGINLQVTPQRDSTAGVSFEMLRSLADGYDLLRLVIETRKDQIEKLVWTIRPRLPKGKSAAKAHTKRAEEAEKFLRRPDQAHTWAQWIRMAVEEILVTDAWTIYPRPTRGGGVFSLDLIDGATIKPLIDQSGRAPLPPEPAYQQVIKGIPAANFTRDELIYAVANPRVNKLYGFSPVEQIITTVNIALKRQLTQINYYTEGNIPEALIGTPLEWTSEQIREFQDYWDSKIAGNQSQQRRAKFVPAEVAKNYVPTREPVMKDVFDEWLARVVCFAFSIPPTPFVAQVNRSVAESSAKQAMEEGILPLMQRIETVMDDCLERMGFGDCDFAWDQSEDEDPLKTAQTRAIYLDKKVVVVNDVRESMGLDPVEWGDEPFEPPAQLMPGQDPQAAGGKPREGQTKPDAKPGAEGKDADEEGEPVVDKSDQPEWLKRFRGKIAIKVERPAVRHQTVKLSRRLSAILRTKARALAADLADHLGDVTKADDPSDEDRRRADDFLGGHDFGDWDGLADALETRAIEVFEIAARDTLVRLGFEVEGKRGAAILDVVHEDAVAFAKKRAAELVSEISERSRRMVRSTVTAAIKEGWSSRRLAEEIAKSPAFDISRADMIARTELAIANSEGYRAGLEESGVEINTKEWLLGGNPCNECKGNADEGPIPFNASFQSGHSWTPAHPNCVCDIAVTVKE